MSLASDTLGVRQGFAARGGTRDLRFRRMPGRTPFAIPRHSTFIITG
jgi:hypothetical protein